MTWKLAGASARGSSHQRSGRPNQDAFEHGVGAKDSALRAVLAVSDGHGSATHFRSDVGSRLAAHIAISVLQEALGRHLEEEHGSAVSESGVQAILQTIVEGWRTAVASDLENNPFTVEEWSALETSAGDTGRASVEQDPFVAYGATLLAAAAADSFVLFLQLGDGDILAVGPDGTTQRPIQVDDRLMGNQTTSLCQPNAAAEFRWAIADDPAKLAAVLASTDGYANSFRSEKDFLQIGGDYLRITREDGLHSLAEDLPSILSEASEKGSGDDITLALMINSSIHAVADQTRDLSPLVAPAKATAVTAVTPLAIKPPDPAPALQAPVVANVGRPEIMQEPKAPPFRAIAITFGLVVVLLSVGWYGKVHGIVGIRHPAATPVATVPTASKPAGPVEAGTATNPDVEKPVIANPAPEGQVWTIAFPGVSGKAKAGNRIPLKLGAEISLRELTGASGTKASESRQNGPYAKVVQDDHGNLCLANLSDDPWAVLLPGKKTVEPPVDRGTNVVLVDHAKITFRGGIAASITLAEAGTAN
ncbi:MAG: protein phosphatase 2C domain-containing protein [Acidobacteriota bacterium]